MVFLRSFLRISPSDISVISALRKSFLLLLAQIKQVGLSACQRTVVRRRVSVGKEERRQRGGMASVIFKMDLRTAFVARPVALPKLSSSQFCTRKNPSKVSTHRFHRVTMMKIEENSKDTPIETTLTDNSHYTDASDFIMDVEDAEFGDLQFSDEDLVDSEADVVDVVGADFDIETKKRKKARNRTSAFMEEISQKPESTFTADADAQPPIEEDEMTPYVRTAVRAADERKAESIIAIRVSKITYITSFVVIATANNVPQMRAVANLVEEHLAKKHNLLVRRKDGTVTSGWLLLDCRCGEVAIQRRLFTPTRSFISNIFVCLFLLFRPLPLVRCHLRRWRHYD